MAKSNPFSLYDSPEDLNRKATREFKKAWKEFTCEWRIIQSKYEILGAADTAAREDQVEWIIKNAADVF